MAVVLNIQLKISQSNCFARGSMKTFGHYVRPCMNHLYCGVADTGKVPRPIVQNFKGHNRAKR